MDRRRFVPIFVPAVFGLAVLFNVVGDPHLAGTRVVDQVRLIAVGLCFGVAFGGAVAWLRDRR